MINAGVIGLIVLTGVLLIFLMQATEGVHKAMDNRYYSYILVQELRKSSEGLTSNVRVYAATGDAAAEAAYNHILDVRSGKAPRDETALVAPGRTVALLDLLKQYGFTESDFALVQQASDLSNNLVPLEVEAMNAVKGLYKDAAGNYTVHGEPDKNRAISLVFNNDYINFTNRIMAPMNQVEAAVHTRTNQLIEVMTAKERAYTTAVNIACFMVLLLACFNLTYVAKKVVRRLGYVSDIMKYLRTGDLTHTITIRHQDEIGELAASYNSAVQQVKVLLTTIKNKASDLSSLGDNLAAHMTETASAIYEINTIIQSTKTRAIDQSASVSQTGATMGQITGTIQKLGDFLTHQNESVEQSSGEIEKMLTNIDAVTKTLMDNEKNVETLSEASKAGQSGLQEVASDVREIAKESEGLLAINAVIEDIATQTNLLSMNAAIEAAHAGESGKGFAVVASEIRKLAENAGEQSRTISDVLRKISASIKKISDSTNNVLGKFDAIAGGVQTVAEQEDSIRAAMEEQSAGGRQILNNVDKVNKMTTNVTDGTKNLLDGSQQVISESRRLESANMEITNGMNEMATGASQINAAVTQINENAGRNKADINSLVVEVNKFKVV
jgi:methyl-accepting chemotaxis protein